MSASIGGGYTGLSAALHLAEAGLDVVLLEAERVGWGASGRNGGQLASGQRRDQDWLERSFGARRAEALWDMAEEAKALVREPRRPPRHRLRPAARASSTPLHKARLRRRRSRRGEKLARDYGYAAARAARPRRARRARSAPAPISAARSTAAAAHLHPLEYALGLARAAAAAGARIFEASRGRRRSAGRAAGGRGPRRGAVRRALRRPRRQRLSRRPRAGGRRRG